MGLFDSIMVPCPKCGTKEEFQSKSGDCSLMTYDLCEAPQEVLHGINKDTATCRVCKTLYGIHLTVLANVITLREGNHINPDALLFIQNQSEIEPLEKLVQLAEEKIERLRDVRERPCKWGRCNGTIGSDNKCNRCGQGYV